MKRLVFETILIKNGSLYNLEYHQKRVDKTTKELFKLNRVIDLKSHIKYLPTNRNKEYRCKVIYSDKIHNIEIKPYIYIEKRDFILVEADFDYSYKYLNRDSINRYKSIYPNHEIIFIKNRKVTDTTIANIAIYKDNQWLTPKTPLLKGTTRARLIERGFLKEADIEYKDILKSKAFAVMNALSGFRIIKNPIFKIAL